MTDTPFAITVRFTGGLNERQQAAFAAAADRWSRMIVGDLPPVEVDGETVDDVLILAEGAAIDGENRVLGQAGPTFLRPPAAGAAALLPAKGQMTFDTADLARMESDGTLDDVITHEMGHVLGIGTIWAQKRVLAGAGGDDPRFTGPGAVAEYGVLGGAPGAAVPVENTGGQGTRDGHWRETTFADELMSGFIAAPDNPLSRMTVASLADLGYQVSLEAAEPYALPTPPAAGTPTAVVSPGRACTRPLPAPTVLPDDSLR